ncbi:GNAT family N-acetyltransferase [Alkalihalophilus marmarensis]|uniref:GNAT family N-acetyltransferase n=1 Tax=Alkalihalophilus marmarensis TaxID=521377 RepID=UPI002DBADCC6|nr:GNAT family N-acetyltransferase [Alkalihalophilus marmarensis]MEC2072516.1 GNAT family N-acetyltransferase [Alkalihalophilus marmarensis]
MKFSSERLTLRLFQSNDLEDVYDIYKDEETCRYLLHDHWTSENIHENFNDKIRNTVLEKGSTLNLAVVNNSKVIGDLTVWYTDMKDTVEIGYCFSPQAAGKGYATEAVSLLLNKLFNEWNVHRVQANMDARNTLSQKLCERVGMRKEAHFIKDFWNKNEWTDSFVYGMLQSDLQEHPIRKG